MSARYTDNSDPFEKMTEVILKDHYDHDKKNSKKRLEDHGGQIEPEESRQDIDQAQNDHSDQDKPNPRLLEPDKYQVDQDSDNTYIDEINKSETLQKLRSVIKYFNAHIFLIAFLFLGTLY